MPKVLRLWLDVWKSCPCSLLSSQVETINYNPNYAHGLTVEVWNNWWHNDYRNDCQDPLCWWVGMHQPRTLHASMWFHCRLQQHGLPIARYVGDASGSSRSNNGRHDRSSNEWVGFNLQLVKHHFHTGQVDMKTGIVSGADDSRQVVCGVHGDPQQCLDASHNWDGRVARCSITSKKYQIIWLLP